MEGLINIAPKIKKIDFPQRGKIGVHLKDGRSVVVPLKYFPSIQELNAKQRSKWYILDGEGFSFDDCPEVYHIEQILGVPKLYSHKN